MGESIDGTQLRISLISKLEELAGYVFSWTSEDYQA